MFGLAAMKSASDAWVLSNVPGYVFEGLSAGLDDFSAELAKTINLPGFNNNLQRLSGEYNATANNAVFFASSTDLAKSIWDFGGNIYSDMSSGLAAFDMASGIVDIYNLKNRQATEGRFGHFSNISASNIKVQDALIRRASLASMVSILPTIKFASRNQAVGVQDGLLSRLGVETSFAGGAGVDASDTVFTSLQSMRGLVTNHFNKVIDPLPEVEEITANGRVPLVLIAQEKYGDSRRAERISRAGGFAGTQRL